MVYIGKSLSNPREVLVFNLRLIINTINDQVHIFLLTYFFYFLFFFLKI